MNLPTKKCTCCKKTMTELVYATLSGGKKPRKVWKPICTDCVMKVLEDRCFNQEDQTFDKNNYLQRMDRMIKPNEAIGISLKYCTISIRNITSVVDRESTMVLAVTMARPNDPMADKRPQKTVRLKTYKDRECIPLCIMTDAGQILRELLPSSEYPEGIGTPTSP